MPSGERGARRDPGPGAGIMQYTAVPVRARKRMRIQRRGSHAAAGESTVTAERTEVHRAAEVAAPVVAAEMRVAVAAAMMPATMMPPPPP